MIEKPELFVYIAPYGQYTENAYQHLAEKMGELDLEALNQLVAYAYKDGVKDGIQFCKELDTK